MPGIGGILGTNRPVATMTMLEDKRPDLSRFSRRNTTLTRKCIAGCPDHSFGNAQWFQLLLMTMNNLWTDKCLTPSWTVVDSVWWYSISHSADNDDRNRWNTRRVDPPMETVAWTDVWRARTRRPTKENSNRVADWTCDSSLQYYVYSSWSVADAGENSYRTNLWPTAINDVCLRRNLPAWELFS